MICTRQGFIKVKIWSGNGITLITKEIPLLANGILLIISIPSRSVTVQVFEKASHRFHFTSPSRGLLNIRALYPSHINKNHQILSWIRISKIGHFNNMINLDRPLNLGLVKAKKWAHTLRCKPLTTMQLCKHLKMINRETWGNRSIARIVMSRLVIKEYLLRINWLANRKACVKLVRSKSRKTFWHH